MASVLFKAAVIAIGAVAAHEVGPVFSLAYVALQMTLLAFSLRSAGA